MKMTEISGNPKVVNYVPVRLTFQMNKFACVMCINHIEFVSHYLQKMDDKDKSHYGLMSQRLPQGKKEQEFKGSSE